MMNNFRLAEPSIFNFNFKLISKLSRQDDSGCTAQNWSKNYNQKFIALHRSLLDLCIAHLWLILFQIFVLILSEATPVILSRRTDGAASAEPSSFELCRVVTEEDGSQIAEIRRNVKPKSVILRQAKRHFFRTRISQIFTNILRWARSQANSRKRLTNRTRPALPLATNGTQECGPCNIFDRLVASSDAFILHVLNKTDSSHSLDSCSLIHSRKLNYIILCWIFVLILRT